METSITCETVSQNTISGGMEEHIREKKIIEIAKKVLKMLNKDKQQSKDQGNNDERETEIEIEQIGKDLNKVREAYFNFLQTQKRQTMARMKYTAKKRVVYTKNRPVQADKEKEWKGGVQRKKPIPSVVGSRKTHLF